MVWQLLPAGEDIQETHSRAEIPDPFAGSAGFSNSKPAPKPASVSPELVEGKGYPAGSAGFDLTSLTHAQESYKEDICNSDIYKEYGSKDPANPASGTQLTENKDSYIGGFACGFSISDPADPAAMPEDEVESLSPPVSPLPDSAQAAEPTPEHSEDADAPACERWVVE